MGLVILGLFSSIGVQQASAASLSFVPAGSQLDGDPIKDILVTPGQQLSFNVNFDPMGTFIRLLTYNVDFDTSELSFNSVNAPGATINDSLLNTGFLSIHRQTTPNNINAFTDTFTFTVTNPGISPHDGIRDFAIQNLFTIAVINGEPVDFRDQFTGDIGQFPYIQQVEVQTPEPTATLSLLALGTLGAASTLKRKQKPSKSTGKELTKVG